MKTWKLLKRPKVWHYADRDVHWLRSHGTHTDVTEEDECKLERMNDRQNKMITNKQMHE